MRKIDRIKKIVYTLLKKKSTNKEDKDEKKEYKD